MDDRRFLFLALFVAATTGCTTAMSKPDYADDQIFCPEGADLTGFPPPIGRELYCTHRADNGMVVREGPAMTWYSENKKFQQGHYRNDEKDGLWHSWHENGNIMEETRFVNGKREGDWKLWLPTGVKKFEGFYVNDEMNGIIREWSDAGVLIKEIPHLKGKKHGEGRMYHPDGSLMAIAQFANDQLDGKEVRFFPNGNRAREASFRQGLVEGSVTQWHENGQTKSVAQVKNGKIEGSVQYWDPQGQLLGESLYEDDRLIRTQAAPARRNPSSPAKAGKTEKP